MQKIVWLGLAAGALVATSAAASAQAGGVPVSGPAPAAVIGKPVASTWFMRAQPGDAGMETGQGVDGVPQPASPRPRKKQKFFGLPLLGALAGVGAGAAALAVDDENAPAGGGVSP